MGFKVIEGGVCAAKGFSAAGVHCGIRKNKLKKDLAMVKSVCSATAAAVYTRNLVIGAPCTVTRKNLRGGKAQAIICNSGIANTCAADGIEKAEGMCDIAAKALGIDPGDIVVASTGVIGPSLDLAPISGAIDGLAAALSHNGGGSAAEAIMTTDTFSKQYAVEFECGGVRCAMGGMAKGSGMIAPNMATMLCFITTDAAINSVLLQKALSDVTADTFNLLVVDGDTSTNDMLTVLANGAAGGGEINEENDDYMVFKAALHQICTGLCRLLASDGEGATKLLECRVSGGATRADAAKAARSVVSSPLFKAAMFGADANWGRVLCALGYSGAAMDVSGIGVAFQSSGGRVEVCRNGAGIEFSEEKASEVLSFKEILIDITLTDGDASATAWGCDLSYDYVKINGDYRS